MKSKFIKVIVPVKLLPFGIIFWRFVVAMTIPLFPAKLCLTSYGHMPRPKCYRNVCGVPDKNYFKPRGITISQLEEVVLSLDEYEAIRLADHEHLYQEEAAARMNISCQTFGRIIEAAHKKIADVLMNGKALKIEGGEITLDETKLCCQEKNRRTKKEN